MIPYFAGPICTGLECWGIFGFLILILIGPFIIGGLLIGLGIYLLSYKKKQKTTVNASGGNTISHKPVSTDTRKIIGFAVLVIAAFIITAGGYQLSNDTKEQRESQKALRAYHIKQEAAANKRDRLKSAFRESDRAIYVIPDGKKGQIQANIDSDDTSAMVTTRHTATTESGKIYLSFHHFLRTPKDAESIFRSTLIFTGTDDDYHNNCQESSCSLITKNERFEIKRVNEVLPPENLYEVAINGQTILVSVEAGSSSSTERNKEIAQEIDQQITSFVDQLEPIDKKSARFLQL